MARQKVIEEKKKTKADQRPPGAGKAAKTLMMKKNLENKPKDTVKKAPRHRHGVARAILANQLNKSGKRVFQRRPVVALIRQLAQELRPETRLSKDFVDRILAVVENEGLELAGSARILAAKDKRSTTRVSDLLSALLISRSAMFDSPGEIRALMIRALCEESVHYCFDPQSGATLIQPWKVQSFTNQERDPLNILRSVEWRVTWPQGLTMELLILSVKLSMSSSFLYSPEKQQRIVQLFMTMLGQVPKNQGPLTRVKQRVLMRKVAEVAQTPEGTMPKNFLTELLAFDENGAAEGDEEEEATKPAPASSQPPALSQEQPAADEEEDF